MHDLRPKDSVFLYVAIAFCSTIIFLADLFTPLGIAVWVFYLAPLILTLMSWRLTVPCIVAACQTALTIAGYLLSSPDVPRAIARVNRGSGIVTVWIVAAAATFFIRGKLAVRRQEWLQSGQALLSEKMAGEQTLEELGANILSTLAGHINAQVAAMFVQENGDFVRVASYAVPRDSGLISRFSSGEGLLGQAIRDQRSFVVDDVPEGYLTVASGLGASRPRRLLIAPAVVDGEANAVVEFGFLAPRQDAAAELLTRVSNAIALTVRSVKFRERLQLLLEETQRQAEELQAQGEELRASNEELEHQSRALQESQSRLELQQAELEQTNANLEEQTQILEAQKTELTHAKNALEAQARELEQAGRYKSDFLARMSHELRTPLNSALILSRLLFENRTGNLTPEQVQYARSIESSGNSLLELINDVLDLAKVEAGRMDIATQHVPLSKITESLAGVFEPVAAEKKIGFSIATAPDLPHAIETDPRRLEQVLKNLISNAIKFTDHGEVTVEIARAAGGRIRFAVRDTGIGIPADQHQFIFDAFRQAQGGRNRDRGGTGLGLSISRELVRLLGGEISLQSLPGQGSTFIVTVPEVAAVSIAEPKPHSAAAVAGVFGSSLGTVIRTLPPPRNPARPAWNIHDDRENLTGGGRTILVVEDDELFAHILRDLAHELDFQCILACTAADGMILAQQFSPSAIVLDVGLPDNSGLALLDRLKGDSRTRHIPVHIVSVHDDTETALSLGAVGYVIKPARREELVAAFRRLEHRISQKVRRLLIVEDEAVQRETLKELLGAKDVETVSVGSAAECLEQLRSHSYDCMVLDLGLPDQSGFQLLETISREDRYSFPPVIVYTGRELSIEEEQALRRYSKSIIVKGAKSPERLLEEVTLFLHQVIADLPPEKQRLLQQARGRDSLLEGRRILLVEDDVRNIFALSSVLEPRGLKLKIARNGREAIEILTKTSEPDSDPVDLVLMDIMMPEMDGLTATREIRKRSEWSKLPIIVLTAKAMKNDQEQALAAGASEYLSKPLDVDQLLSVIRVWMPR